MSLEEAKDRICQLEDAVTRLDYVRKHLTRNASEICGEIRCNISRSVECLRNRELALLNEVDKVRGIKEETLSQQQGKLNQAINILHKAITLIQDDSASEKHLADTLVRLNQLDMLPEETPYISFHSDLLQIRETLSSFGRVDANGLPHAMVFEDPGKPSASLPRHVEEYEDVDHHIFYKTLQEIQMKPTAATNIKVNFPKLSQHVEHWLHKKPTSDPFLNKDCWTKQDQDALSVARTSRPSTLADTRPASTSALSQLAEQPLSPHKPRSQIPSPDSSCSLNNWLALIKNHADLEEEHDFEIFDNSRQKFNSAPTKQMAETQPACMDLQKWLCSNSSPGVPVSEDFFGHIVKDPNVWLVNVCQQLASVEDMKPRDPFQDINEEPTSWLRSRAHTRLDYPVDSPGSTKDLFSHINKDMSNWLVSQGSTSFKEKSSKTEQSFTSVASPSKDKWLLKSEGRSASISKVVPSPKPSAAITTVGQDPVRSSSKLWLLSPDKPMSIISDLSVTGKAQKTSQGRTTPTWESTWLLKCLDPCYTRDDKPPCYDRKDKRVCDIEDIDVWLVKAPEKQEPVSKNEESKENSGIWMSDKFPEKEHNRDNMSIASSDSAAGQGLSDWLFVPSNKLQISEFYGNSTAVGSEDSDKASCSDSWSICSTPHSLSSDQHVKDVTIATDYFNKWLI